MNGLAKCGIPLITVSTQVTIGLMEILSRTNARIHSAIIGSEFQPIVNAQGTCIESPG